ncbi:hypothetical protein VXQ18_04565, partial [Brucella abortus]|nr:hypothetical protein [Brucella abortus]
VGASVAHHLIERGWTILSASTSRAFQPISVSTAHASDFCYATSHDFLSCWTTLYSIDFCEKMGHYARVGGIEVARAGDDARMDEIRRKVASGKAFGTRAPDGTGGDQGKIPADRGKHGSGRALRSGCRPCHPSLTRLLQAS